MGRGSGRFDPSAFRAARNAEGLTQEMLADLTGTTAREIAAYENGRVPEPTRLMTLASALGLRSADLMGGSLSTIADLRRAAGLTAEQAAERLGMSRNTYRKLEREGIWSATDQSLIARLAQTFGVGHDTIDKALQEHPAILHRRHAAELVLTTMADTAAGPGGGLIEIKRNDPGLKTVAESIGYPVDAVRPVLNAALRDIHATARSVEAAKAVAKWEGEDPKNSAWWPTRQLQHQKTRLLENIRATLRGLMPRGEWALLVALYRNDVASVVQAIRANRSAMSQLLGWGFVERAPQESNETGRELMIYTVTDAGRKYITRFAERHLRAHPDITRPLQPLLPMLDP